MVLILGRLVGDAVCTAHHLHGFGECLWLDAGLLEQHRAVRGLGFGKREEQMLGGDVRIAERLGARVGGVEHRVEFTRELRVGVALLGIAPDFCIASVAERGNGNPHLLENGNDNTVLLVKQYAE